MKKYDMDQFFNWLAKPMSPEDVNAWHLANNIIPEMSDLFRDFCFSFIHLMKSTYLGDSHGESKETKIGLTKEEKQTHFKWCWKKTVDNFIEYAVSRYVLMHELYNVKFKQKIL